MSKIEKSRDYVFGRILGILDESYIKQLILSQSSDKNALWCAEEAGEWIQSLSKMAKMTDWETQYGERRNRVIEETADLIVCIAIVCGMYDIRPEELASILQEKMRENLKRIGK